MVTKVFFPSTNHLWSSLSRDTTFFFFFSISLTHPLCLMFRRLGSLMLLLAEGRAVTSARPLDGRTRCSAAAAAAAAEDTRCLGAAACWLLIFPLWSCPQPVLYALSAHRGEDKHKARFRDRRCRTFPNWNPRQEREREKERERDRERERERHREGTERERAREREGEGGGLQNIQGLDE